MLKNYPLYIDFVCSQPLMSKFTAHENSEFGNYIFKIRHMKRLKYPERKYDLLIFDLCNMPITAKRVKRMAEHYDEIIFINAPQDHTFFQIIAKHDIHFVIRYPLWEYEYENAIRTFLRTKRSELEHYLYLKLFDSARNSIVMTDIDGNILFANPYFEEISGYHFDELSLKSPSIIKSDYHELAFYENLWETITSGKVWEGIFINRSKEGELFYEEATISPITNAHGDIERFLKIGKNITREEVLLSQLSKEVKLARKVIDMLLPKHYQDEYVDFNYYMIHYNQIGGDFIYFSNTATKQYHFALIDVIGHGVSSALIALTLTQMFKDYIKFLDLNQTVKSINHLLMRLNDESDDLGIYVTGVFIELDIAHNTYQIINAGHPDILILDAEQNVNRMPSTNMILGVEEQDVYKMYTGSLHQIEKILCYTDGLYESNQVPFERALTILEESLSHLGKDYFFESILHAFLKQEQVEDDITICKIELKK